MLLLIELKKKTTSLPSPFPKFQGIFFYVFIRHIARNFFFFLLQQRFYRLHGENHIKFLTIIFNMFETRYFFFLILRLSLG